MIAIGIFAGIIMAFTVALIRYCFSKHPAIALLFYLMAGTIFGKAIDNNSLLLIAVVNFGVCSMFLALLRKGNV